MHPTTIFSFLVSSLAVTQVHAAVAAPAASAIPAASGFSQSCSGSRLDNSGGGIVLIAQCKRAGGTNTARLDLGQCYINDGGVVKFSKGGGFAASCGTASLEGTEATMHVGCGNGHGGTVQNTVHLDLHVGNSGGNLVC